MARHVSTILCRKGVVERDTGIVSLLEVLERLNLHGSAEVLGKQLSPGATIPHQIELVSWWVRSDFEKPEKLKFRFRLETPSGYSGMMAVSEKPLREKLEELGDGIEIDLTKTTGARLFLPMIGIPWYGFGIYWIVIESKQEDANEWLENARLPIQIGALEEMPIDS